MRRLNQSIIDLITCPPANRFHAKPVRHHYLDTQLYSLTSDSIGSYLSHWQYTDKTIVCLECHALVIAHISLSVQGSTSIRS